MKIRIAEILMQTGLKPSELAALLFPESNRHTQAVTISKWMNHDICSIRLDQLKVLRDLTTSTNINKIIDFNENE